MIFYIPALLFLIYNLYKKRTKASVLLIILCLVSGAAYMGAGDLFIEPIHLVFPAVAIIASLCLIYLSRREYTEARSDYLKERRMAREAADHRENNDEHERILITNSKTDEEKVIYLKREDKNVPHGTIEDETKKDEEEKN